MIKFPCNLHNLHKFKQNDKQFVADLDAGVVVPMNEVICDVLDACGVSETDVIIETLADKYNRSDILEALTFLSKLSEIGLLFSPYQSENQPPCCRRQPKIFVTSGILESRKTTSFSLNAANHRLLTMLANHADLYLTLPEKDNNRQEIEEALRSEGIQPIFFRGDRTFSPAKFIPKDCDGILALAPLTLGEQVFLKFNTIPVVLRLSNETLISHEACNTVLERYAALRNFDAFACDASWTQTFFSQFGADSSVFHHVPYGVDTSIFKPMDKAACKHQLAQALGNETILQKPLVGVVPGLSPHETTHFLRKLRAANPNLNWLVIDSSLGRYSKGDAHINFFSVTSLQDKEASPFIFNALDMLLFPAILGSSPLILLEVAACGIPTIVWGYSAPEGLSGAGFRFVPVSPSLFDPIHWPVESISQELKFLVENPDEQEHLGQAGLKAVSGYTWETVIQRILNLFGELRRRPMHQSKSTGPRLLFTKHYNPVCGGIETEALVLSSNVPSTVDVEQAIAMTLLEEHTPMAVKTVLQSICQEPERVERILENLT